ncbi:hypothetical protein PF005_g25330 [Phytophthora fragariae]|uniref:Uncharacterized protein n=1 Tax=Phytophthora fragariae TaxID=53985 RepID=A0A6A3IA94_9STRA|nr:hypothetical protein PF003_g2679 [Phytophthora fragariae]KAE8925323.1 hypothetical protein PF009_g24468 [Phytophthora fragariae]KAE8977685.1 hypothetical protein PF011_g23556 [Phytophthora fragariae]KAE9075699.1 hypothetical protein PF010_g24204 [Phytophthora fragariae]KAE9076961.1 hypothetical protein PF007_g24433 [Phytophthora fragariae]
MLASTTGPCMDIFCVVVAFQRVVAFVLRGANLEMTLFPFTRVVTSAGMVCYICSHSEY